MPPNAEDLFTAAPWSQIGFEAGVETGCLKQALPIARREKVKYLPAELLIRSDLKCP